MSDNVVSFKKKLTLEQRRIAFIVGHLTKLRNDHELLTGYFPRPYLGTEQARTLLDELIHAALQKSIDWLIEDLGDDGVQHAEETFETYAGLIQWFQDVEVVGARYAVTLHLNDKTEVMQFIFINHEGHVLGLIGIYDGDKDIVTGVIQTMNKSGMINLGFCNEA